MSVRDANEDLLGFFQTNKTQKQDLSLQINVAVVPVQPRLQNLCKGVVLSGTLVGDNSHKIQDCQKP